MQKDCGRNEEGVVLVLNIEIGTGRCEPVGGTTQEVRVRPHDDPHDVARKFCADNGLEPDIEDKIAAYIVSNLPTEKRSPAVKASVDSSKKPAQRRTPLGQRLTELLTGAFNAGSKYGGKQQFATLA